MKKLILFFLLTVALIACQPATAPESAPAGDAPSAEEAQPVAGTPQLIEFYADW